MTQREATLDRLIHAAYDAAVTDDWTAFLSLYGEVFPASKSSLSIFDGETSTVNVALVANYDTDALATYAAHYSALNPWVAMTTRTDPWSVSWGHETVPTEIIRRSEFYNDWLRHQDDVQMGFGINVASSGRHSFVITNNFNPRHLDAAEEQFRLAETLVPHLRRAFDIQRRITGQSIRLDALEQGLAAVGHAVFAVTGDERVTFMNPAAEALMREGGLVRAAAGGALRFVTQNDHDAVFGLVRKLGLRDWGDLPPVVRLAGNGGQRRVALVTPGHGCGPAGSWRTGGAPPLSHAVVFVIDLAAGHSPSEQVIATALGLPPALARLAAAFAEGRSLREHAAQHGLSYETVRTQMKQLMDMAGVNRQALLMRALSTLTALPGPGAAAGGGRHREGHHEKGRQGT